MGSSAAMQNLPLSVPAELGADSPLAQEMSVLLQDYSQRLTQVRVLNWLDLKTFQARDWTPHLEQLKAACRLQPKPCALLLHSQLKALQATLPQANAASLSESVAVTLSAMADLCTVATVNGYDSKLFDLCGGQAGIEGNAAIAWSALGYDELFLAYFERYEQKRLSTIAWLAEQPGEMAKEQRQRLEGLGSDRASANAFAVRDALDAAAIAWLQLFSKNLITENHAPMLLAALNMARLSYQLGEVEQGKNWQNVAEQISTEHPELQKAASCAFDSERARVDLAQALALHKPFDTATTIERLIKRDCPYTTLTIEYALASLRSTQLSQTAATLALVIKACTQSAQCSQSRVQHLQDLMTIAQGREAELLKLAERWLAETQIGRLNAVERQIVWALADALARSKTASSAAQQLYVALDDQVHNESVNQIGLTPGSLKNLARYEELIRLRVKETVRQGASLRIGLTESLRAQSLLQRLRIKRWQNEFAAVHDAAALAKLQAQLAQLVTLREYVTKLAGDSPLKRALRAAYSTLAAESEALAQEQYLQELAARKAEASGASKREAWLGVGYNDLAAHDEKQKVIGQAFPSLGAEEAYLSWLRVPGGYVGSLAVPDPQHKQQWDSHYLVSHFVPVSEAMAATLELYRKLLQSGANESHDSKFITPSNTPGLVLNLMPIWRQPDGSFAATEQPLAGSVRVQALSELGDAIFKLLLAPFQADLAQAKRLIISPDGALAYLPFETLSVSGTPILDSLDIAYVQSLAVHAELTQRARSQKTVGPALLSFADPDYTLAASKLASARAVPKLLAEAKWPQLNATRIESAALLHLFPGGQQRLGAQASRKQLDALQRSGKLKQYRILHFATHGYVDDARRALVLSMADGPDQGYLQDTDVLDLQLNTDLVLLSACDTGIGRNVSGEGVMGLPYAFMLAGNSNTVMSLWPVDDKGTAAFMTTFMAKVRRGTDLLTALNQTKREFARGVHGKAFSDPLIWAAFVQYGIGITVRQ